MSKQSLLKRLSGADKPAAAAPAAKATAALTSAEVERRIEAARAEVAELERQRGELGLAVETGSAGSNEKLAASIQALSAARERVTTLEAVAQEVSAQEREAERLAKKALWESRAAAFRRHLLEQEADAQILADALAAAIPPYRRMIERINRIQVAHPDNATPDWTLAQFGSLPNLVSDELDRLWENPNEREYVRFPGCARIGRMYDTRQITALVEHIKRANAHAIKHLKQP